MDTRVELLNRALINCRIGKPLFIIEEAVSTNDVMQTRADSGAPEGCVIVANKQTGGRGRMGRSWLSLEGKGLYISVLLRPPEWPASASTDISMFSALSVARALGRAGLKGITLKWPNDILVYGKKIAGILIEPSVRAGVIDHCVMGIGINISHQAGDLRVLGGETATSCLMEGLKVDCDRIIILFLDELNQCYHRALHNGRNWIIGEWAGCAV